jgi:hypothetical protein
MLRWASVIFSEINKKYDEGRYKEVQYLSFANVAE